MALEAKAIKRWEFDSIQQASSYCSLWFLGTSYECLLLQEYLNGLSGEVYYDAQEENAANNSPSAENVEEPFSCRKGALSTTGSDSKLIDTPPRCGSYKRRKIIKSMSFGSGMDELSGEAYGEVVSSPSFSAASTPSFGDDGEVADLSFGPSHYKDVLVLFRFNNPDLPFELKKIIVSDLRLLRLLEYGLPSWALFLQSYPVFCHFYRPWMCPLARGLYILVSMTTVLIGFYDLYKNVPVLKATASRLCGPFFEYIESWEMISRIRYLGTMLFLQHFEKSVAWFLMISRAMKSLLAVLTKPLLIPILELMEFLLPLWNECLEVIEVASSMVLSLVGSVCGLSVGLVEVIFLPLWSICLFLWGIATSVLCPLFWIIGEVLASPFRLVTASASFIVTISSSLYSFLIGAWSSVSGLVQLASATEATVEVYEVSIWQSLWNDLFSQIFRAIRSIIYGLITFFSACNRHRLSIYNHLRELFLQTPNGASRSRCTGSAIQLQKNKQLTPLEETPKSPQRHSRRYKKKLA